MSAVDPATHEAGSAPARRGSAILRRRPGGSAIALALALAWLAAVLIAAVAANWLPIADPAGMDLLARMQPPGAGHWLGTDTLGRDILARIVYGARVSLTVGVFAPLMAIVVGGALGVYAGFKRGPLETIVLGFADVLLAFPALVLALALAAYLGTSLLNITLILGLLTIPAAIRVARAVTLGVAEREYITAARVLGAGDLRIMRREILPNIAMPMIAFFLITMAIIIVAEGVLSFLGLGVPPPTPSWGGMISAGRNNLADAPYIAFVPSAAMFLTVLSLNLLGDAIQAQTEPDRGIA